MAKPVDKDRVRYMRSSSPLLGEICIPCGKMIRIGERYVEQRRRDKPTTYVHVDCLEKNGSTDSS